MKFVVDSNYLRSPGLSEFLAVSSSRIAVLTDYVAMEAYKAKRIQTLVESFSIVARFPRQFIVLKSSATIAMLSARPSGLQRRLIDFSQSRNLPTFAKQLRQAQAGDQQVTKELLRMAEDASTHMEFLLSNVPKMLRSFVELAREFSEEELRTIRLQSNYPQSLIDKVMKLVGDLLGLMLQSRQNNPPVPKDGTIKNLFLCRVSLCFVLLILDWVHDGQQTKARPDKILNDHVDMFIAAYSTYFDGVLTADAKLARIAEQARYILRA